MSKIGRLTLRIPVKRGRGQQCILAPLLFNIFINPLVDKLNYPSLGPPKLGKMQISVLPYAYWPEADTSYIC